MSKPHGLIDYLKLTMLSEYAKRRGAKNESKSLTKCPERRKKHLHQAIF
jgi:hypothetical protein